MSEISRRAALVRLAAAIAAAGPIDRLSAHAAHMAVRQAAAAASGAYTPAALSAEQFRALERLADLIIPADNGKPGALQTRVPAWIDSLLNVNPELKSRYTVGLAWIDKAMQGRHGVVFATATAAQQTSLLDQIAYQKNRSPELDPGIDFFILARRMTVDGFYTSPIGMRDLYPGNAPQTAFTVPQAAYDHVLGRSPFK
jgi:hypothetical protein